MIIFKRILPVALALTCLWALPGCSKTDESSTVESTFTIADLPKEEVSAFSYEESIEPFITEGTEFSGDVEVITTGFRNTEKHTIETSADAFEQAKAEYSGEYTTAAVFYDSEADMWLVHFNTDDSKPNSENWQVYLDSDGLTQYVVHSK